MRINIALGLLLLTFIQCSKEQSAENELQLHFNETLVIGTDDEEAPNHEIFRNATHIEIDDRGWMYVVDSGAASIRIYNEDGVYQKNFGNQGSGPGEFNAIGSILIDSRERFLLLDPSLARVTAFTLDGDFIEAREVPSVTRVQQMAELSDGRFVLVGQHNEHFVHIVDSNFSGIETSLVAIDDLLTSNEREERVVLQFYPGSVSVLPKGSIVFAPALYDGELFVYRYENESWSQVESIGGFTPHQNPATFSLFEESRRVDLPMTFPDEGRYAVQFHSFSQGLYHSEATGLFHFSFQETGRDGLDFIVEKFSDDGELEGASIIDSINSLELTMLSMDTYGNIYLSDSRDFPKLRRLAINGL